MPVETAVEGRHDSRGGDGTVVDNTLPYLPGLDGLRAIAVAVVIGYHLRDVEGLPAWFVPAGGFLGVEAFFAISGFLITSLLVAEHANTGGVNLRRFWVRRARRLLPALFGVVGGTAVLAAVFAQDALDRLRSEIIGAGLYVTNWQLIWRHESYFETSGRPPLLRHLWSLAIEEQFYLVWPVLFALALARWGARTRVAAVLVGAATSAAIAAALFGRLAPYADVSAVYYRTDARASALLLGAAVAFVWRPWRIARRRARARLLRRHADALGWLGLVGLVAACYWFTDDVLARTRLSLLFRGGLVATSVATLLVVMAVAVPGSRLGALLGSRPLRAIGLRSYGLYLWHWPIFQGLRPGLDTTLDGWGMVGVRLGLTVVAAEVSFRVIEMPFRTVRTVGERRRAQRVRAVALATLLVAATATPFVRRDEPAAATGFDASGAGGGSDAVVVMSPPTQGPTTHRSAPPSPSTGEAAAISTSPPRDEPLREAHAVSRAENPSTSVAASESSTTSEAAQPAGPLEGVEPSAGGAGAVPDVTAPAEPARSRIVPRATLFGDSVLLGAADEIVALGDVVVDARIGRQWWEAAQEISAHAAERPLGGVVILHLGNNGPTNAEMLDEVITTIGPDRRVVFVTVRVPAGIETTVNRALRAAAERYPSRITIADWHALSDGSPSLFAGDGVHLTGTAQRLYAELIQEALAATDPDPLAPM